MSTFPSLLMERYSVAPIIPAPNPDRLTPIYVSETQSEESLFNLAVTYCASWKFWKKRGVQLFEVPKNSTDGSCQYALRGYSPPFPWIEPLSDFVHTCFLGKDTSHNIPQTLQRNGWKELADKTDFTCRKGFQKLVVISESVCLLQWGDGSWLGKEQENFSADLQFAGTATPVYRFASPLFYPARKTDYSYSTGAIRLIESPQWFSEDSISIWIKPCTGKMPSPYSRFESTYMWGPTPAQPQYHYLLADIPQRFNPPSKEGDDVRIFQQLQSYQRVLKTRNKEFRVFLTAMANLLSKSPESSLKRFKFHQIFDRNVLSLLKLFLVPNLPMMNFEF